MHKANGSAEGRCAYLYQKFLVDVSRLRDLSLDALSASGFQIDALCRVMGEMGRLLPLFVNKYLFLINITFSACLEY